ncbi:alpha/beta hydrolase [Alkalihalobacillus pseudalcaliphilus]|uniref:alpha/beta hydrolase n=1 Tax=Alkalihalobacillus pseudalcaliphilus TaxID=79884 RepID=UPI00069FA27B|nr:alpha/beta hydrolase [Alkalihalobacillus pseudalcaliphilus]
MREGTSVAFEQIKDEQRDFSFINTSYSEAVQHYLQFYHLPHKNIKYCHGYIHSSKEKIFVQSFSKSNPKGTVFLMHGYLDHVGCLSRFIHYLIEQNYQVIGFDLPGHGLSTGEKASIQDFEDYVEVLDDVIHLVKDNIAQPLYLVAHSTGAAISFSYLLNHQNMFKRVVLIAPLIRAASFRVSKCLFWVAKPFIRQLPRVFRANSNEQAFLEFIKSDPLQARVLPMKWIGAKLTWFKRISKGQTCSSDVLILQGDRDKTVDWKYNLSYLEKSVPNNEIHLVKGAGHHLLNEVQIVQNQIFKQIERFFTIK